MIAFSDLTCARRLVVSMVLAASILTVSPSGYVYATGLPATGTWLREAPYPYSVRAEPRMSGKHIRSESTEYSFEWRRDGWDGRRATKGAEIKTRPMPWMTEQWLSFEFFAPRSSFEDDSKFTIIMQYHSVPDVDLGEKWRNPVSSLVVRNGLLQYDFRSSAERVTPEDSSGFLYTSRGTLRLGSVRFDSWNRVVMYQRFDPRAGKIRIWINGVLHERENAGIGFNDRHGRFLKLGLYVPQGSDLERKQIRFRNVLICPAARGDDISACGNGFDEVVRSASKAIHD